MGFIYLRNDKGDLERVHTSLLGPQTEEQRMEMYRTATYELPVPRNEVIEPLKVTPIVDGSVVVHLGENLAYEVHPNGDLVVILKEGERTVFREFGMQDLAFPTPKQQVG